MRRCGRVAPRSQRRLQRPFENDRPVARKVLRARHGDVRLAVQQASSISAVNNPLPPRFSSDGGHKTFRLVGAGMTECGRRDLRRSTTSLGIATMAVTEHFFRSQPVFKIATFGTSRLHPKQVGGVLNFEFGWIVPERWRFAFHGRFWIRHQVYRQSFISAAQALRRRVHFLCGATSRRDARTTQHNATHAARFDRPLTILRRWPNQLSHVPTRSVVFEPSRAVFGCHGNESFPFSVRRISHACPV
jgi:hypothetical protein